MKTVLELFEMPKNCMECPCARFDHWGDLVCQVKDENGTMLVRWANKRKRRKDCPLKPARYITQLEKQVGQLQAQNGVMRKALEAAWGDCELEEAEALGREALEQIDKTGGDK